MKELKLNNEFTRETMKEKIADDLVNTVKELAKSGKWEMPFDCLEDGKAKTELYYLRMVRDNLPLWFCTSLGATGTIMQMDEVKGLGCVSALYDAAQRAPDDIKTAALDRLVGLLRSFDNADTLLGFSGFNTPRGR